MYIYTLNVLLLTVLPSNKHIRSLAKKQWQEEQDHNIVSNTLQI